MPIAAPESSSSATSRRFPLGRDCLVAARYTPMSAAPKMARYSASSPEETAICRTKGARVPNTTMASRYLPVALSISALTAGDGLPGPGVDAAEFHDVGIAQLD